MCGYVVMRVKMTIAVQTFWHLRGTSTICKVGKREIRQRIKALSDLTEELGKTGSESNALT